MEGPQIITSLSGTPCIWFSFTVEENKGSGKRSRWETIEQATSEGLCLLVDDTGKCVIDPEGASVIPAITQKWYGSGPRPQSGHKLRKGWFFGGRYRYTEKRMHPMDTLFAIGLYKTVGGANTDFNINAEVATLLKEWKSNSAQLLAQYDQNKDGKIDVQEWEGVRNAALQNVLNQHQEFKSAPAVNIMCQTHDLRRPYILSAIPQHTPVSRYSWYAGGLITLFLWLEYLQAGALVYECMGAEVLIIPQGNLLSCSSQHSPSTITTCCSARLLCSICNLLMIMPASPARSRGIRHNRPTISVKKPGISKKKPEKSRINPSIRSIVGTSPRLILSCTRWNVCKPCRLDKNVPSIAVRIQRNTVGNAPIRLPTRTNR